MVNCGVRLYTVFSPGKSKHVVSEKDYKRLYSPASGDEMNAQLLSSWRLGLDRVSKDALDRVSEDGTRFYIERRKYASQTRIRHHM
jgi:hypothetical protein